jgi:hypothetical protein
MNDLEIRRLAMLAIEHHTLVAMRAMRMDIGWTLTDPDGVVYVVHRPLPLSRNQPTQEIVMPDNKENAARLREMIASLNAGSPISFGDAYRNALEAGAVALIDQDATRRAPTERGTGGNQPGDPSAQGTVSGVGTPDPASPVPSSSRHLTDVDDGKPVGSRADQASEQDRNLGVRRDDVGGARVGGDYAAVGQAPSAVAREHNPTGKVK